MEIDGVTGIIIIYDQRNKKGNAQLAFAGVLVDCPRLRV